jgi:hypothetical protein
LQFFDDEIESALTIERRFRVYVSLKLADDFIARFNRYETRYARRFRAATSGDVFRIVAKALIHGNL